VLKAGDKAPDFRLKTDEGAELSLAGFRGKRVVLFFFPKANTPG
jgi:peroxiredoxin Q/BCP